MRAVVIVVAVLMAVAVIVWRTEARVERAYDQAYAACITWAQEHVYPDGRRVVDDVDPVAWCTAE